MVKGREEKFCPQNQFQVRFWRQKRRFNQINLSYRILRVTSFIKEKFVEKKNNKRKKKNPATPSVRQKRRIKCEL